MAKRIGISQASTAVGATAQLQVPKALADLAGNTAQFASRIGDLNKASKDALTKSQFKMNSLTQDDAWSILGNDNKSNYNEDTVFSSIDELSAAQANLVDEDEALTNQAKDALLLNIQGNANKSKDNYRSNVAGAQTKAAIDNTNTILSYQIRSGDLVGVSETITSGVSAGIIAQSTGEVLQKQAVIDVDYYSILDNIDETNNVVELGRITATVKSDKRYSDQQRNNLLSSAAKQQTAVIKDSGKYEDWVEDRINDGSAVQDQIDIVQDPVMRASLQLEYDIKIETSTSKVKAGIPKKFPVFQAEPPPKVFGIFGGKEGPVLFKASPEKRLGMVQDNITAFKSSGTIKIPNKLDRNDGVKSWRTLEGQEAYEGLMWQIESGGYDPILRNSLRKQAREGKLSDNNRVYVAPDVGLGISTWSEDMNQPQSILKTTLDDETKVLTEDSKIGLYGKASLVLQEELNGGANINEALTTALKPAREAIAVAKLAASLPGATKKVEEVIPINDPLGLF